MKKLMFIFGTRPEFIKVYPVILECQKRGFQTVTVNTGQHQEMLDEMLKHFNIVEDYDLNIMNKCNGLTDILCETLKGLEPVMKGEQPDLVLVHGDTSATLAGSLQALYQQIPVAHVEAGLRTYNKYSPFPEEMNRQLTGVIADLHFTPTQTTKMNLINEGKRENTIHVVGNSAIDMLKYTLDDQFKHKLLDWSGNEKLILVTVHRRENLDDLRDVFTAFNQICEKHSDVKIIYPVHMNPRIQKMAKETITSPNIKMTQPLNVVEFHNIMKRSHIILTDSGGIQEEAPALGKPVLVMRDTTERPEGVEAGTLKLVGTDTDNIIGEVDVLLTNQEAYNAMANVKNPYGDGTTSKQIVDVITKFLSE
ncbi:MAG: non-hydrolyzing UDP-N-acetylglucosamine 2-epimerase [Culicoidibacterales bacterium]